MTNKTVLTDYQIADLYIKYKDTEGIGFGDIARAIEQVVFQSPEIQKLKQDSEILNWLEKEVRKHNYGISIEHVFLAQESYIQEDGFRLMRRNQPPTWRVHVTLRDAIKAEMENKK